MPNARSRPTTGSASAKLDNKSEVPMPAAQPKVSKKTAPSSPIKKTVLEKVIKEADVNARQAKAKINSQISHMGNRPIALVATHSVLKGIDMEKSAVSMNENQIKNAKISINTEILKKAVIKELKKKKSGKGNKSPMRKSAIGSPSRAKSPKRAGSPKKGNSSPKH